jgi:hypothetical protein
MFVPLVAIPLFAVFGMPQLSTVTPTAQVEDLKFASGTDKPSVNGAPQPQEGDLGGGVQMTEAGMSPLPTQPMAPSARNDADPFAEFVRPADGESRRADTQTANQASSPERRPQRWPADDSSNPPQKTALAANDAITDESKLARPDQEPSTVDAAGSSAVEHKRSKSATRLTSAFDTNQQTAGPTNAGSGHLDSSDEARGWKAAVARLNALGIRDYQLQPGERDGEFHFSCRFVSRSNPRVMRRFEAEAREPLEAVEQVLAQVDEWNGRRTAEGRVSSSDSPSHVTALAPREEAVPVSGLDVSNR